MDYKNPNISSSYEQGPVNLDSTLEMLVVNDVTDIQKTTQVRLQKLEEVEEASLQNTVLTCISSIADSHNLRADQCEYLCNALFSPNVSSVKYYYCTSNTIVLSPANFISIGGLYPVFDREFFIRIVFCPADVAKVFDIQSFNFFPENSTYSLVSSKSSKDVIDFFASQVRAKEILLQSRTKADRKTQTIGEWKL